MCFFAVTGGTIAAIVFYHDNGLHGNYPSFTAVKIPRGNPRGKPWFFPWCYGCFVLLRFRLYAFVEAAALRSIVLRYAGAPIATRVSFSFFGDVAFSEYFFVPFLLSLCMESCCCCCFLTLTDPLRIQPWSQDRRNQTKSTGNRRWAWKAYRKGRARSSQQRTSSR